MAQIEGYVGFKRASISHLYSIWYKISGPWSLTGSTRPLLTEYGGPGYTHDYLLPLEDLCRGPSNLTVIFFDQLGSGRSTYLPEKLLDYNFWTEDFFLGQVATVLNHLNIQDNYVLFGHSWGGCWALYTQQGSPRVLRIS